MCGITRRRGLNPLFLERGDLAAAAVHSRLRGFACRNGFGKRSLQLRFIAHLGAFGIEAIQFHGQPVIARLRSIDRCVGDLDLCLNSRFFGDGFCQFNLGFAGGPFRPFGGAFQIGALPGQAGQFRCQSFLVLLETVQRLQRIAGQLVFARVVVVDTLGLGLQVEQARFQIVAFVGQGQQPVAGFAGLFPRPLNFNP